MALCKTDSDPFRNDQLRRLFEVSPPSVSEERLARASLDYMVSALAVQLNQHLWNHTSVELSRTLGHEFINGFNYEIMATFRCNHDIQVLLGGSDVADRIHYRSKYITYQQKQLDSQTYNMPNRQEIAGPLAALYLYRGSCCYSSGVCASLPLGDAVRQLSMTGYVCTLVNASDDVQKSKYRAVSNLDDYVFRPKTLEAGCLYEFTMWYFKKKSDSATSSRLRFLVDHPLCNTHRLGERYVEVVPVIQGFLDAIG
ncbi:hypothetical protein JG688_00018629 [Phytophthora aleatoria]|uniref:Uncharacterized protein n=1 Tax=Phytophthora aleatoria TaxID=2496075 RepID=A0A8J5IBM8_9STRA|nr:hypothetical protein JG688_00018629 [Phytophthora aleatoria]